MFIVYIYIYPHEKDVTSPLPKLIWNAFYLVLLLYIGAMAMSFL